MIETFWKDNGDWTEEAGEVLNESQRFAERVIKTYPMSPRAKRELVSLISTGANIGIMANIAKTRSKKND